MRSEAPAAVLPWQGVIAGAVGGLAASWAMEQFQSRFSQATDNGVDEAHRRPARVDTRVASRSGDHDIHVEHHSAVHELHLRALNPPGHGGSILGLCRARRGNGCLVSALPRGVVPR